MSVMFLTGLAVGLVAQGKIAFDSCGDGNCEIYLINPDGTGEARLTFNPATDSDPALVGAETRSHLSATGMVILSFT